MRFGHEFGKWISTGINAARVAISSIPVELEPAEFLQRATSVLESAQRDVENPDDEDGWTTGGVATILVAVREEASRVNRETKATSEGVLAAIENALRDTFPERFEMLVRQVALLLLGPASDPDLGNRRGPCSWCGLRIGHSFRFPTDRIICKHCVEWCWENLQDATSGKQIPAPGMVIADVTRALRASTRPDSDRIAGDLERRGSARPSRQPRGFLPSCQGCGESFERCRWSARLPGIDLCDGCIEHARTTISLYT